MPLVNRAGSAFVAGDHAAKGKHGLAFGLQHRGHLIGIFGGHDDNHADAAVEGAQHFVGGNAAGLGKPGEHGRCLDGAKVDFGGEDAWAARAGCFPEKPPPVIWASAFSLPVSRIAFNSGFT